MTWALNRKKVWIFRFQPVKNIIFAAKSRTSEVYGSIVCGKTRHVLNLNFFFSIESSAGIRTKYRVKCRKITHGYCTLKIAQRDCINSNHNYTRDIMHTRQHGHHRPANSNSNPHYMCLHFASFLCMCRQKDCMRHCASQFHISSTGLLNIDSQHKLPFVLSNRKFYWKCPAAAVTTYAITYVTSSIIYFIIHFQIFVKNLNF